jgi:hypothetical protein
MIFYHARTPVSLVHSLYICPLQHARSYFAILPAIRVTIWHDSEVMDDTRSVRSNGSSLCLDEDDRWYLEALKDRDYVATKNTRHPLGLFSVVAFILQQVIGGFP